MHTIVTQYSMRHLSSEFIFITSCLFTMICLLRGMVMVDLGPSQRMVVLARAVESNCAGLCFASGQRLIMFFLAYVLYHDYVLKAVKHLYSVLLFQQVLFSFFFTKSYVCPVVPFSKFQTKILLFCHVLSYNFLFDSCFFTNLPPVSLSFRQLNTLPLQKIKTLTMGAIINFQAGH